MTCQRRQLLALGLTGLAPVVATGAEPKAALVANVIDIAPWGRPGTGGQVNGVYAEIFRRLAELSGCAIELRLTPIKRAVMEVSTSVTQATMMLEREDLNRGGIMVGTVTTLEIEVWLPRGSPIRSLAQLAGKTVATLRGPAFHEEFDANNLITKFPVAGARQQLQMMRAGRVDGALGVRQNFLVATGELGLDDHEFADPIWLGSRRVLLWVSPSLRDKPCQFQLAQSLTRMRLSGEIDRLIATNVYADR